MLNSHALARAARSQATRWIVLGLLLGFPCGAAGSDPPRGAAQPSSQDGRPPGTRGARHGARRWERPRPSSAQADWRVRTERRGRLRIDPDRSLSRADAEESDDDPIQTVRGGTSSKAAREAAAAALPMENLPAEDREAVREIVQDVGLFRALPTLLFRVNPHVYRFFLAHPEAAVSIWRAMEVSQVRLQQTGPKTYRTEDNEGTSGEVRIVYRDDHDVVLLCEGLYKNSLLVKPIRARAVLHLNTRFTQAEDGTPYVAHRACLYVSFPSQAVETAARLLSPVSSLILDRNFREVSLFVHMMTLAMTRQPGWVERIVHRMDGVPVECKKELLDLTAHTYVAAYRRQMADRSPVAPLPEPLLPPTQAPARRGPATGESSGRAEKDAGERSPAAPFRPVSAADDGPSDRQ